MWSRWAHALKVDQVFRWWFVDDLLEWQATLAANRAGTMPEAERIRRRFTVGEPTGNFNNSGTDSSERERFPSIGACRVLQVEAGDSPSRPNGDEDNSPY